MTQEELPPITRIIITIYCRYTWSSWYMLVMITLILLSLLTDWWIL